MGGEDEGCNDHGKIPRWCRVRVIEASLRTASLIAGLQVVYLGSWMRMAGVLGGSLR